MTRAEQDKLNRLIACLSSLGDVAAELVQQLSLKGSLRTVLGILKETLDIPQAALYQFQPNSRRLVLAASNGLTTPPSELSVTESSDAFWGLQEAPLSHEEVAKSPEGRAFIRLNSEIFAAQPEAMWLPLAIQGNWYGLLIISLLRDEQGNPTTQQDVLGIVARQIAMALHSHALKGQLSLKVLELERLQEVSGMIHASLSRTTINRELVESAVSLINARRGALFSVDEMELVLDSSLGLPQLSVGDRWSIADSWLESVISSAEARIWDSPLSLPTELDSFACLAVPIRGRERVVGVLVLLDKEAGRGLGSFTEGDQDLLTALAVQAAASMENARLYELATVDGLTKLFIRRHFEQRFADEARRAARYGAKMSLLMVDIDHFKKFNDTYGHATGDEVLKLVAATLQRSVREDLDIPARYGGEEMMVLMPETDAEGAMRLADRIRIAIAETPLPGPDGEILHVTVSIGVATLPDHAMTEETLMARADEALYASKRGGRNRVTLYAPPMTM